MWGSGGGSGRRTAVPREVPMAGEKRSCPGRQRERSGPRCPGRPEPTGCRCPCAWLGAGPRQRRRKRRRPARGGAGRGRGRPVGARLREARPGRTAARVIAFASFLTSPDSFPGAGAPAEPLPGPEQAELSPLSAPGSASLPAAQPCRGPGRGSGTAGALPGIPGCGADPALLAPAH